MSSATRDHVTGEQLGNPETRQLWPTLQRVYKVLLPDHVEQVFCVIGTHGDSSHHRALYTKSNFQTEAHSSALPRLRRPPTTAHLQDGGWIKDHHFAVFRKLNTPFSATGFVLWAAANS